MAIPCPRCGYDLRARTGCRCPECGQPIETFDRPLIPWIQPAGRSRLAAMWATIWLVFRRPQVIAAAVAYPVQDRDTRGFQRVLVAWAWLWTVLSVAVVAWFEPGLLDLISAGFGWPVLLAEAAGWLLLLWLATSLVAVAFHSSDDPEYGRRCQAAARFAAAPLALVPVPLPVLMAVAIIAVRGKAPTPGIVAFALLLGPALGLALPMLLIERAAALARLLLRSRLRRIGTIASLPLLWLVLALLLLVGLPGLVVFVCVVIASLT